MKVLPDTSIWVDFLRKGVAGPAAELDNLLAQESIFVCGPVVAELLAGMPSSQQDDVWIVLSGLPWADLDRAAWQMIGETAAALRRKGVTAALTDVSIAVASVRVDAALWTRDVDFERIRAVLPQLRLHK